MERMDATDSVSKSENSIQILKESTCYGEFQQLNNFVLNARRYLDKAGSGIPKNVSRQFTVVKDAFGVTNFE